MLNFAWNCFRNTGSVDAWLLLNELREAAGDGEQGERENESETG
ncbi:YqzL family protein [Staphylospora marina]|nr:YqzL family protein [Staphylospora marina]